MYIIYKNLEAFKDYCKCWILRAHMFTEQLGWKTALYYIVQIDSLRLPSHETCSIEHFLVGFPVSHWAEKKQH